MFDLLFRGDYTTSCVMNSYKLPLNLRKVGECHCFPVCNKILIFVHLQLFWGNKNYYSLKATFLTFPTLGTHVADILAIMSVWQHIFRRIKQYLTTREVLVTDVQLKALSWLTT